MALSVPVLSRVLEGQAAAQLPESLLAAFRAETAKSVGAAKFSAKKNARWGTLISVLVVAAVVCGGAIFASAYYHAPELDPSTTVVFGDGAAANELAVLVKSIDFAGGDCECGHQNPGAAVINGDAQTLANSTVTYEIRSAASGQSLFAGAGATVSAELAALKEAAQTGRYSVVFHIEDENQNIVTMEREFEIK
jgi:hypothetical protein